MRGIHLVLAALVMSGCTITIVDPKIPPVPVRPQPVDPVPPEPPIPTATTTTPPTPTPIVTPIRPVKKSPKPPVPLPSWYPIPSWYPVPSPVPSGYPQPSWYPSYADGPQPATVYGTITDEDGARLSHAKVRLRSLNPSYPYDSTVDVINGAYVINMVPAGVQVEISATRDGWTRRSRVETVLPGEKTIIDFNAENRYFISNWPEVESTEPTHGATNVDTSRVILKLTLSEPLDTTNQRRFADAIRLFPANRYGDPKGAAGLTDLNTLPFLNSLTESGQSTQYSWFFAEGSTLDGDDNPATVTWDAEGRSATFTFKAPYPKAQGGEPAYQLALVGPGDAIEDRDGNDLGSGDAARMGVRSEAGALIFNAFRQTDIGGAGLSADPWIDTHQHASVFTGN